MAHCPVLELSWLCGGGAPRRSEGAVEKNNLSERRSPPSPDRGPSSDPCTSSGVEPPSFSPTWPRSAVPCCHGRLLLSARPRRRLREGGWDALILVHDRGSRGGGCYSVLEWNGISRVEAKWKQQGRNIHPHLFLTLPSSAHMRHVGVPLCEGGGRGLIEAERGCVSEAVKV